MNQTTVELEAPPGTFILDIWHECRNCMKRVEHDPERDVLSHYDPVTGHSLVNCTDGHGNAYGTVAEVGSTLVIYRTTDQGGFGFVSEHDRRPAGRHAAPAG